MADRDTGSIGPQAQPAIPGSQQCDTPALSVVVPVHNEAGNIVPLLTEIAAALDSRIDYEVVYVDDGSTDATAAELGLARRGLSRLRVVRHRNRCGQSTALRSGVKAARGAWIVTLDGDGQNDPADIPALWAARTGGSGAVAVLGVRAARNDRIGKRWGSLLANRLRRWLLRDRARDTGCGIKLFPRAVFLDLPYFDHMHRFLPALFIRAGIEPIEHLVNHRPRMRGRSHYGLIDRALVSLMDLFGVAWLQRRSARPVIEPEEPRKEPP
jgi:dolichol-phosphate mannosyltransferase